MVNVSHGSSPLVKKNQKIKKGQEVMIMWNTGTDGAHLHFGMRFNGISMRLPEMSGFSNFVEDGIGYYSDNEINNQGLIIEEDDAEKIGSLTGTSDDSGHNISYAWAIAKKDATVTLKYIPNFSEEKVCRIFVFIPSGHATSTSVKYRIICKEGEKIVTIDQSKTPKDANRPQNWVDLGVYTFTVGRSTYLEVSNATSDYDANKEVGFDAVYFREENDTGGEGGTLIDIDDSNLADVVENAQEEAKKNGCFILSTAIESGAEIWPAIISLLVFFVVFCAVIKRVDLN